MTLRADKLTPALEEPSEAREGRVTVPETSANASLTTPDEERPSWWKRFFGLE